MPRRPHVLILSHFIPPVGGAGVQRVAKLAKHLPSHGWDVTILHASNASAPARDLSLVGDLAPPVRLVGARTFEPPYAMKSRVAGAPTANRPSLRGRVARGVRNLLVPDPQVLWLPAALHRGRRILRDQTPDVILASAPPFSVLLLGSMLSRTSGIPLVADFRDEWDINAIHLEHAPSARWSRGVQTRMQDAVLRVANHVVATTPSSAGRLADRILAAGGTASTSCVWNGWDVADLGGPSETMPGGPGRARHRVVYIGTLWNLTTWAPVERAVAKLAAEDPALLDRLEFVVVGRKTPRERALLDATRRHGVLVTEHEYVPHAEAVDLMRNADTLLLLLADAEGADRVVPAKTFEYAAAQRPVLAIAPAGDLADLLASLGLRSVEAAPDAVIAALRKAVTTGLPMAASAECARYERRALAGEMADVLKDAMAARAARSA